MQASRAPADNSQLIAPQVANLPTTVTAAPFHVRDEALLPPWETPLDAQLVSSVPTSSPAGPLTLDRVLSEDATATALTLLRYRGQAPGLDGITCSDLGRSERWEAIRAARQIAVTQVYRPTAPKVVGIPKHDGGTRELKLRGHVDRAISLATLQAVSPIIDPVLLPNVYGFRPRRGIWDLLADLCRAVDRTGHHFLIHVDIEKAFDNVRIARALRCYARHIQDDWLILLIEHILRGHRGISQRVGIEQGCSMSPITLNVLLHPLLDLPLTAAGEGFPLWYGRYADNLLLLCQSASDSRERLAQVRTLLSQAGLRLKAQDGDPSGNLRRQRASVEILGYQVRLVNNQLQIGLGEKAYAGLEESLTEALAEPAPTPAARMVVRGWLTAAGPAVENAGPSLAREVRRRAAWMGFRDVGRVQELEDILWESHQKWLRLRARAQQG